MSILCFLAYAKLISEDKGEGKGRTGKNGNTVQFDVNEMQRAQGTRFFSVLFPGPFAA